MNPTPSPYVDLCDKTDWNVVITAGNWVPFTGGIAGFLFAGITFLLSATPTHKVAAARGFKLLLTAFFAFTTLAYLSAGISGEQVCLRARTSHTIIGGILATAIIAMCVALSWILVSFGKYTQEALTFLTALIYFALTLATVMVTMSATSYYRTVNGEELTVPAVAMISTGALAVMVEIIFAVRTHRSSWNKTPEQQEKHRKWQQKSVNLLAYGTLAYLAAASITGGLVLTSTSRGWEQPAGWVIHVSAWCSLLAPLAVLLSAVGAIAHHVPDAPTTAGAQATTQSVPAARTPEATGNGDSSPVKARSSWLRLARRNRPPT